MSIVEYMNRFVWVEGEPWHSVAQKVLMIAMVVYLCVWGCFEAIRLHVEIGRWIFRLVF